MLSEQQLSAITNANKVTDYSMAEISFAKLLNESIGGTIRRSELAIIHENAEEFFQFLRDAREKYGKEMTGLKIGEEEANYSDLISGLLLSLTGSRD